LCILGWQTILNNYPDVSNWYPLNALVTNYASRLLLATLGFLPKKGDTKKFNKLN